MYRKKSSCRIESGPPFYSFQSKLTIKAEKWQQKSLNMKRTMLLESLRLNISARLSTWAIVFTSSFLLSMNVFFFLDYMHII